MFIGSENHVCHAGPAANGLYVVNPEDMAAGPDSENAGRPRGLQALLCRQSEEMADEAFAAHAQKKGIGSAVNLCKFRQAAEYFDIILLAFAKADSRVENDMFWGDS